ncbi:MAG: ribosome silencing factor [Treponema sp.]|nr:ribosome silencing factor [Treponema sp.]
MSKTFEEKALEIAALMEDSKGQNVTVLDISQLNSWTDFFVIVTVSSGVQSQGMLKAVKDYAKENDLEIHLTHQKTEQGEDWNLIDLGSIVVHLMSEEARNFYELEKLWHAGKVLKGNI